MANDNTVMAQRTPVSTPKTTLELPVAADGLDGLLAKVREEIAALVEAGGADVLNATRTLEELVSKAIRR